MHHTYEPIMQRLLILQSEYKTLLLAADAFKNLEHPDLVIGDGEYEGLMKRLDETCKNVRYKADGGRRMETAGVWLGCENCTDERR